MNRKNRSIFASLLVLALFGVLGGCRETPITSKPPIPTVFVGEINGIVRDGSSGAPLNNVTVTLLGVATDAGGPNPTTTTTDANGLYVFRNLDAGTYKIAATAPAGFAATRVQDGIVLEPRTGTNEAGVVVTRTARDIRLFTANASVTGTASFTSPQGANLPLPAGTPVFVDFSLADGDSPAGRTVGDVQVSLVRDTVRAGGLINITGLPAVGALADAGEVPRLVIPNFVVGGVVYGDDNGRAITVNLTGLRGATPLFIRPGQLISTPNFGPTTLLATSAAPGGVGSTTYGTTDSVLVVFNKPMQAPTVVGTITRTRTPYSTLQTTETRLNGVTTTALPAGTYLGQAATANQAFVLRLNRAFVTGSDHEVNFTGALAADGSDYRSGAADRVLRSFTTRTGIRLLSTNLDAPAGLGRRTGVPLSGSVTITTAVPAGFTVNPVVLRGPNRNLEVRTGDVLDAGTLFNRDFPIVAGIPAQSVDSVAGIVGGTITFGYVGLTNVTADPRVGATGNLFHIAPTRVTTDAANAETPLLDGATNATNRVPGNIRSTVPGDFGIERAAAINDPNREYNLVRVFETSVTVGEPIQIISRPTINVPTDTVIRISFSRAITIPAADTLRGDGATGGAVRLVRVAPGTFVTGTAVGTTGTAPTAVGAFANNVTAPTGGTAAGDSVSAQSLGYRATLLSGGTLLELRRLSRLSDGTTLPLETGTTYSVDLQIPGLATGTQGTSTSGTQFIRVFFSTRAGVNVLSASPLETIPGGTAVPGSPRTGSLTINFTEPLAPEVQFFTRGLGANVAVLNVGAGSAATPAPPASADLTTIRNNAIQGLPPQGGVDTRIPLASIDCVGVISGDRRSVTIGYRDLPVDRRFRVVGFHPNANVPAASADAPRVFTLVNGIAPSSVLGVIRSAIPGDLGIGGPNTVYRNQINFTFNTNTQAPTPAIVTASNASGNLNFDPATGVTLTFSRPMRQSQTGFTIEKLAGGNNQTHTAGVGTPGLDTLRWNVEGTQVTIRRVRVGGTSGDTTRAFEAGVFYRISPTINPDSIQTTDGGALIAFQGVTFRTQLQTTITGGTVSALDGSNSRSLNTGTGVRAVGDTAGRITLTFSNTPAGFYNVRGVVERRFVFALRDTSRNSDNFGGGGLNADLGATNGTAGSGGILGGNLTQSAFIDSTITIDGNTMRVNYYVSSKLLRGRDVLPLIDTATRGGNFIGTNNFVVEFRPNMGSATDGGAPLQVFTTTGPGGSVRTTAAGTSHPSTLRSTRGGDFGVVGVDSAGTVSAIRNTGDAFDFQFIVRPGASGTPASFPDLVVDAVNNAVESVSTASRNAVRSVRSWFKRVTE